MRVDPPKFNTRQSEHAFCIVAILILITARTWNITYENVALQCNEIFATDETAYKQRRSGRYS